jgi:Suppressor of fused protein (SUFU)
LPTGGWLALHAASGIVVGRSTRSLDRIMNTVASAKIKAHIERFFAGHQINYETWDAGPIVHALPHFQVACIAPGPKSSLWTYVSVGACEVGPIDAYRLEFLICAPSARRRLVGFLAMTAHYHKVSRLGLGHTYPIGEPWDEGSNLDHILVSLPYTFGPSLEVCDLGSAPVHILWLLPITDDERQFKIKHGVEALEAKFDEVQLEHWNSQRTSVIQHAV